MLVLSAYGSAVIKWFLGGRVDVKLLLELKFLIIMYVC